MNGIRGRILIVPVGHYAERAKERPFTSGQSYRIKPDHTYLITQHHDPKAAYIDKFRTVVEDVYAFYSQYGYASVLGAENYFDIFELMSLYRYICDQHTNDFIFINVGCGSKLTAIAGFMISGWYDNVQCYYPKITITRPEIPTPPNLKNRIEGIQMIQSFPVKKIDQNLLPVLNFLKTSSRTKKKILKMLQENNIISSFFISNDGTQKERSLQSLYNILKRNFIDPLEDRGLIEENQDGKLKLTDQGTNVQLIFGKSDFHVEQI